MKQVARISAAAVCLAVFLATLDLRAADDSSQSKKNGTSSLDELLLEGLGDEPATAAAEAKAAEAKAAETKAAEAKAAPSKPDAGSPLDDDLLRDLQDDVPAKEVPTVGASRDPLVAIGKQMRSVETRLAQQKLDDQTGQLQQKILDDLAALLTECKKQCQGGGGKPGSKPGKDSGSAGGGSSAGKTASDAARDSSDKLRERNTEVGRQGALVNAMKESWGNLPEHARSHLRNAQIDSFLPKYELMLEKYFKRLGEDDVSQP